MLKIADRETCIADAMSLVEDLLPTLRLLATEQHRANSRLRTKGLTALCKNDHLDRLARAEAWIDAALSAIRKKS